MQKDLIGRLSAMMDKLRCNPSAEGWGVRCEQAMEAKQLQKESMGRLNVMMDELRNSPSADQSAKNLGDEGTAYISEALAFNDRCDCSIRVMLSALGTLSPMSCCPPLDFCKALASSPSIDVLDNPCTAVNLSGPQDTLVYEIVGPVPLSFVFCHDCQASAHVRCAWCCVPFQGSCTLYRRAGRR